MVQQPRRKRLAPPTRALAGFTDMRGELSRVVAIMLLRALSSGLQKHKPPLRRGLTPIFTIVRLGQPLLIQLCIFRGMAILVLILEPRRILTISRAIRSTVLGRLVFSLT